MNSKAASCACVYCSQDVGVGLSGFWVFLVPFVAENPPKSRPRLQNWTRDSSISPSTLSLSKTSTETCQGSDPNQLDEALQCYEKARKIREAGCEALTIVS